jgi:hypothetical protein
MRFDVVRKISQLGCKLSQSDREFHSCQKTSSRRCAVIVLVVMLVLGLQVVQETANWILDSLKNFGTCLVRRRSGVS